MYYLGYNMSGRVVSDIQTRAEAEKIKVKAGLCKSTWICITYTDTTRLWFFFVFSSWIINEFLNQYNMLLLRS
jgi:hypothetical protein